jgi:putative ABC transport system substrate-binding protein
VTSNVVLITKLALDAGLPAISSNPEFAVSGGLIAYAASIPALFQRAADDVDKILRGAKPADISFQQPTKFDLVINLKSWKALESGYGPNSRVGFARDLRSMSPAYCTYVLDP